MRQKVFIILCFRRLTPPFAAMVLLQVTILPYMGNGPMWSSLADPAAEICRKNWWSGLLYVQNYVQPNSLVNISTKTITVKKISI